MDKRIKNHQIFRAIICLVAVAMMYMLMTPEVSTERLGHHEAVLGDLSSGIGHRMAGLRELNVAATTDVSSLCASASMFSQIALCEPTGMAVSGEGRHHFTSPQSISDWSPPLTPTFSTHYANVKTFPSIVFGENVLHKIPPDDRSVAESLIASWISIAFHRKIPLLT